MYELQVRGEKYLVALGEIGVLAVKSLRTRTFTSGNKEDNL